MKEYFLDKEPKEFKSRVFFALWVVLFAFSVLVIRLWYLQIIRGSHFSELSRTNSIRLIKAQAPRGIIYDRNGGILAENRPGFDLSIIPEDVQDWEKTKKFLTRLAGIDEKTIEERLRKARGRPPYRPVKLKEDLTWEEMVRVAAYKFELPGVDIDVGQKRIYAYNEATTHLMGYLGEISEREYSEFRTEEENPYSPGDVIGKAGAELAFEDELMGINGGKQIEVDALGRLVSVIKNINPYPGNNVHLTIDLQAQIAAWEAMEGRAGAVVAMDPQTGEVLAMVSTPSYNPNDLIDGVSEEEWTAIVQNPMKVLTNRVIQGLYPPASTFKVITAAAALEEGVIDPSTKIYAGPSFKYGNHEYRDWKEEGHGTIDVHRAIVESADTFFYQVGLKVGLERLARYSTLFGFGQKTGIAFTNEKNGLVPTAEWKKRVYGAPWFEGETVSVSVGQGFMLTTPLQLLNAYSAIANGGTLYVPQLVGSVDAPEGVAIRKFTPVEKRRIDISGKTLAVLKDALRGVVAEDGGTARFLNSYGLDIAGKTGTAQVMRMRERIKNVNSIPYKFRDHGWFVGYAPSDDPKIAVVVLVEHGGFGASSAAPVALKVMQAYLEKKPEITPQDGSSGPVAAEKGPPAAGKNDGDGGGDL
ncbi:MAG: penicillin-binding protein 2 [Deltaproteobacteria bacterium]|nr:penicillin-binding protein 2 [Deltaproteobacteria bacterium]